MCDHLGAQPGGPPGCLLIICLYLGEWTLSDLLWCPPPFLCKSSSFLEVKGDGGGIKFLLPTIFTSG